MPVAPEEKKRRAAALRVLGEADAALADFSCDASTECCRFGLTGREPSMTEVEWTVLAAEVARQGRRLPRPREDGVCAFLSDEGRCTVYAARPFGCRTFFCERARGPGPLPRKHLATLIPQLEALSTPTPAARARSLTAWLRTRR